ncbi:AbiH family protein [Bacteroides nordii]|uniref:AbiH family protein n=1 Tax=Bacteroides nordii TaxID=291645 RepID=UPI002A830E3C|nr:AbiH family protein [Bacteroides nordii]
MNKDRKRVLIIGNGFDLCLGRKTSYKDFCQSEFCPKNYPSPLIKHLNDKWNDNLDAVKWYDLENELYNYYIRIKNNNGQIIDLYNDKEKEILNLIQTNGPISKYNSFIQANAETVNKLLNKDILWMPQFDYYLRLSHEDILNSPIERDKKALQLIKDGLIQYLIKVQQEAINENSIAAIVARVFMQNKSNDQIVVYSFNYTSFSEVAPNSSFAMEFNDTINYVHGCILDENIILGTRDEKIAHNYDFIQKSFDSQYNPPAMVYDLMDADDITIFGHSLGINDSQYFKAFFERQSSSTNPQKKNITIFTKDAKSEIEIKRSLQEMTNWNLTSLYGLNNLQIIKTDECVNNPTQLRKYIKMYVDNDKDIDKIFHK